MSARLVATPPAKSIGPFLARHSSGHALVAYVATGDDHSRQLIAAGVPLEGVTGELKSITAVPQETTTLAVRAFGGADKTFVTAWSALVDRGEQISLAVLDATATRKGAVADIARTRDHVAWLDVIGTPRGGILLWAEETHEGDANLFALPLGTDGKPRGQPGRVAKGLSGWQISATATGVGLALVSRVNPKNTAGSLAWQRLDGDGRPVGNPLVIAPTATVDGEVEVAPFGAGHLFAWTDRSGEDSEVMLAAIDDAGRVTAPRRALDARGGAAVVALTAGKTGAVLAWDDPRRRARSIRELHLARIVTEGGLAAESANTVEIEGPARPELVATATGYAMLLGARVCLKVAESCQDAPGAPTFLRLDAQLVVTETHPFRLGDQRDLATLGWGLQCGGDRCSALAATAEVPSPVRLVDLAPRPSVYRSPVVPPLPPDAPRVAGVRTIASGDLFADVDAGKVGDATLVASITAAAEDPNARGEKRNQGAKVSVRLLDANGEPAPQAAQSLSTRAISVGGVAIAPALKPEDGAAVAWVARDNGDPQVHLARLDRKGRRQNEVQLTSAKGDASHVALVAVEGGWVVAWVDERDGNGEVYAAKVDRELNRAGREERITNAPGDAGDVTLTARGDKILVAWADARDNVKEGFADIYVATLRARDAKRAGEETRILATAAHSRSPSLATAGAGFAVAWIEEAPLGLDGAGMGAYGAMMSRLDPEGHPERDPTRVPLAFGGVPTAIRLDGSRTKLRALVARSSHDEIALDAIDLTSEPPGRAHSFIALEGPASLDVSLALVEDAVFYVDQAVRPNASREEDGGPPRRVRRAVLSWRR